MKWVCIVTLLVTTSLARADASDELRNADYGVTGGVLAAITPAFVGGFLLSESDGKLQTQTSAIILMQAGFAIAPFIAHAGAGEYGRGLAFSAVPTASVVAMLVLLHDRPHLFVDANKNASRYVFASLLGLSVVSGVIGIWDGFGARDRVRKRMWKTIIAPQLLPGGGGLGLSHTF
jgi:hypothetical protein